MERRVSSREVLEQLDEDWEMRQAFFPDFDHGNNYHVDQRMSAYGGRDSRWVIVIEQLAVNPRAWRGGIHTCLYYHGNAITLPPQEGWGKEPVLAVWPIEDGSSAPLFESDSQEAINSAAKDVRIRGRVVPIRTDENYYWARKIDSDRLTNEQVDRIIEATKNSSLTEEMIAEQLKKIDQEMRPRIGRFELSSWHLMRGLVPEHREHLLATENERRTGVPADLQLLLQIDEWDHATFEEDLWPS